VIASLWSIDDNEASGFFSRFYRKLQFNFDAADALRATQVETIERGGEESGDPRTWAAFEVIGGNALPGSM
jgi:CHAT domain-containing protein